MDVQELSQLSQEEAWKVKSSQEASGFIEATPQQDYTSTSKKKRKRQRSTSEDRMGGKKKR